MKKTQAWLKLYEALSSNPRTPKKKKKKEKKKENLSITLTKNELSVKESRTLEESENMISELVITKHENNKHSRTPSLDSRDVILRSPRNKYITHLQEMTLLWHRKHQNATVTERKGSINSKKLI
jgi:hypothetical protein